MSWLKKRKKPKEPHTIRMDLGSDGVFVIRIQGVLTNAGLTAAWQRAGAEIDRTGALKMLVVLEDFRGWEKGGATDDISFMMKYDSKNLKVAITGDPQWKEPFLMWMGAGRRLAKVEYFGADDLAGAQTWLKADGENK